MALFLGAKPSLPHNTVCSSNIKDFYSAVNRQDQSHHYCGGGQERLVANSNSTGKANYGSGTGGGGGGYSEKTFAVTAGETFTITIGAGGATTLAMNDINSTRVGNNGGNTTFVTASAAVSVTCLLMVAVVGKCSLGDQAVLILLLEEQAVLLVVVTLITQVVLGDLLHELRVTVAVAWLQEEALLLFTEQLSVAGISQLTAAAWRCILCGS